MKVMNDEDVTYLKTLSILYVEDDDSIREQLGQFLKRRCGALYLGANGKEGLDLFERHAPDMVISDILMPVMNGLDMVNAIRSVNRNIPVILTTAFEEPRYFQQAIDLCVDKYVVKPINLLFMETALLKCTRTLRAEVALREAEQRKAELIEIQRLAAVCFESQEGMFVTDAQTHILRTNHAFSEITGYSYDEIIGQTPRVLHSGRHDTQFYEQMWKCINQCGYWKGEIWNRRKNGEIYPEALCITAVKDDEGIVNNYVATFSDITINKAIAKKIEHLAFYDPLTDLPNRRLLLDRLKMISSVNKRSGKKSAVLFIDMDNFKMLNDTLGHDMGDLLLKQVAQRLQDCVRHCDTVARLGGDEFVVLLNELGNKNSNAKEQAEVIGLKILSALNKNYQLNEHDYHSTPSIGAVIFDGHEQSSEEPLKQADIAMYQAKLAGRNALRFFNRR